MSQRATATPLDESAGAPAAVRRVRKNPEARRAEILEAATAVFSQLGYESAGLAEISDKAQVSKGLLYHYFPEGRPALFAAVIDELLTELQERLAQASKVPFSARRRVEHLLATLYGFFNERPEAFQLLFADSQGSRDELVVASTLAAKVEITSELAAALATVNRSPEELLAVSHGVLGFATANLALCLSGQVEAEVAWRVTCEFATAQLD